MIVTSNQVKSNLSVEVLKSNMRSLVKRMDGASWDELKEINKDMTYYSNLLYEKLSFDEYISFDMELDELR